VHASPDVQLQSPTIECIPRSEEITAPSPSCSAPSTSAERPWPPACSAVRLTRSSSTPHGRWMASSSLAWQREGGGDADVGGRCGGVKEAAAPVVRTSTAEAARCGDAKEAVARTSEMGELTQLGDLVSEAGERVQVGDNEEMQ
jgi:hypothetical protein